MEVSDSTHVIGICALVVASQARPPLVAGNWTVFSFMQYCLKSVVLTHQRHTVLWPQFFQLARWRLSDTEKFGRRR
jgi:hypothetical protein